MLTPWGRLTLQSGKPRMDEDVASNILFYTPFERDEVEIGLPLSTRNGIFDVFLNCDGDLSLMGPWVNNRPLVDKMKINGLYFNVDLKALYLGSVNINEGICKWQTRPAHKPYGCNNELGVFNAYNRLPFTAINRNSNEQWNYASSGLRYADNSNLWRINWIDGLGDVFCQGKYEVSVAGANLSAAAATVGVGLDQDTYPINWDGALQQAAVNNTALGIPVAGTNWTNGSVGRHFWQAMEQSTNVPITFYGNNFACLTIELNI